MAGMQAQFICNEDQRGAERHAAKGAAAALIPGADAVFCIVLDVSDTGARISLVDENTILPKSLKLFIEERDLIADCTVVWRKGKEFGVSFDTTAVL